MRSKGDTGVIQKRLSEARQQGSHRNRWGRAGKAQGPGRGGLSLLAEGGTLSISVKTIITETSTMLQSMILMRQKNTTVTVLVKNLM